jgi:hypothetical protein
MMTESITVFIIIKAFNVWNYRFVILKKVLLFPEGIKLVFLAIGAELDLILELRDLLLAFLFSLAFCSSLVLALVV